MQTEKKMIYLIGKHNTLIANFRFMLDRRGTNESVISIDNLFRVDAAGIENENNKCLSFHCKKWLSFFLLPIEFQHCFNDDRCIEILFVLFVVQIFAGSVRKRTNTCISISFWINLFDMKCSLLWSKKKRMISYLFVQPFFKPTAIITTWAVFHCMK